MKLNDRYIKATLAGIPYLLPYGQLIAAPAPATLLALAAVVDEHIHPAQRFRITSVGRHLRGR